MRTAKNFWLGFLCLACPITASEHIVRGFLTRRGRAYNDLAEAHRTLLRQHAHHEEEAKRLKYLIDRAQAHLDARPFEEEDET